MNILFYGHGGSHNHGCEAIIRSTRMIVSKNKNVTINVASNHPEKDKLYFTKSNINFYNAKKNIFISPNIMRYIDAIYSRTIKTSPLCKIRNKPTLELAKICDVAFSIGGDNYSENNGILLSDIDEKVRAKCHKTVLWGCSLDEKYLDPKKHKKKIKNLKKFDLITARDSITYKSLIKLGLNNVRLYSDPAFALPVDENIQQCFKEKETVGINISPLIEKLEKSKGITLKSYSELIKYILNKTDYDIALIPHVVWPNTASDIIIIKKLLDICPKSNRIKLINDSNCMKIKGYISKCKFFIGARTHSTIAAYSTCVPTLVVSYSVKAKGIAKDIFGTSENYVVPIQSFQNKDDLIIAFKWLIKHEKNIKSYLENFMPVYIENAWKAGNEIKKLMEI